MHFIWKLLQNITKGLWLTLRFIREMLVNIVLIAFVVIVINLSTSNQEKQIHPRALLVNISGVVVDNPQNETLLQTWLSEAVGNNSDLLRENNLFDLVEKIKIAKNDPLISGLVLSFNNFQGANQANLQALGEAIEDFSQSKKPVIAYADNYTQQRYYLASFADEIFMAPYGAVDIHGMATNNLYFKSLLDKLSVNTHVFRVGTYKSAVEPFIRDDMSPEAKEANTQWLNALWNNYLSQVAKNRNMSQSTFFTNSEKLVTDLKNVGGDRANLAIKLGWIDQLADRVMMNDELENRFGINTQNQEANVINLNDYQPDALLNATLEQENIAAISVEGTLIDGESANSMVGAETIASQIRKARLDKNIKALILRINCPGGSVTAAELIHSELVAFKLTKKPIVVSFGGIAASGGYWIAMPADYIYTNANTLTGSIGIFGVLPTFENTLSQVGINTDGVATSALADTAITKALPKDVKAMMQLSVENGYQRFLTLVAEGRKKTIEDVDKIAQGRVWSGTDAIEIGLADSLGNFDEALEKASELANLSTPKVKWYSNSDSFFQQLSAVLNVMVSGDLKSILPVNINSTFAHSMMAEIKQYDALLNHQTSTNQPNLISICISCQTIN